MQKKMLCLGIRIEEQRNSIEKKTLAYQFEIPEEEKVQ
jgi:hypothetical protein